MSWDDAAANWDDDPAVRAYSRAAFDSLISALRSRGRHLDGGRVVDFGCGTGLLAERIAAHAARVVALDLSPAMIEVLAAKQIDNVQPVCGALADLAGGPDLPRGGFDLVICSSVCAFVEDYAATVAQLVELLATGGLFVQWDWELDPEAEQAMGLSREAMATTLAAAGLEGISVDVGFEQPFEGQIMAPLMGVGHTP